MKKRDQRNEVNDLAKSTESYSDVQYLNKRSSKIYRGRTMKGVCTKYKYNMENNS